MVNVKRKKVICKLGNFKKNRGYISLFSTYVFVQNSRFMYISKYNETNCNFLRFETLFNAINQNKVCA